MSNDTKNTKFHLMTKSEVSEMLAISIPTLYRMLNPEKSSYVPGFPQPVKV